MKNRIYLIGLLVTISLTSCTVTRDNYDPSIDDEEACRELVKVAKCLNMRTISKSDYIRNKTKNAFSNKYKGSFIDEYISLYYDRTLLNYRYLDDRYKRAKEYYESLQRNLKKEKKIDKDQLDWLNLKKEKYLELKSIKKMSNDDELNSYIKKMEKLTSEIPYLHDFAEIYYYNLCKSDIIPKNKDAIICSDNNDFCKILTKQLDKIFQQINTPRIEWVAKLLNDDYQEYQVWDIGKEGGKPVRITVWFNKDNERTSMTLFHSK